MAANHGWHLRHVDLKTAFLQGEEYDLNRDVVCQLPPESGLPWYMGARLKKPAYGMNDAPRRWWNRLDKSLTSYGLVPARADRCAYVLYEGSPISKNKAQAAQNANAHRFRSERPQPSETPLGSGRPPLSGEQPRGQPQSAEDFDNVLDMLVDPIYGAQPKDGESLAWSVST